MLGHVKVIPTVIALALAVALFGGVGQAAEPATMPPVSGPVEPRVQPIKGDDGLYHQTWFAQTFLDLKDDHAEAKTQGKRFAVIFEQRGCIYCTKMHTDVLSQRYINDYVRENFTIVQLDLWGARTVTDFDGKAFSEKKLAERWGVLFTPTIVFFKEDVEGQPAKWGAPLEVARLPLGFGPATFYDLFTWIRTKTYEKDVNFQRFHISRMATREAGKAQGADKPAKEKVN
ncbi:MAG: thioredoxin family protein [Hyphomicrobiaceae bacterium]